jgi:hypothetical protein
MKVVLAHLDKRFAQEQLYSNAVKTTASSTPCIAARARRPVPTSKSAAKNETLIFIRSLPFSVSAYDIGNNRATPFSGNEIYDCRGSENFEGFCVSRSSVPTTKNETRHQQKPKSRSVRWVEPTIRRF